MSDTEEPMEASDSFQNYVMVLPKALYEHQNNNSKDTGYGNLTKLRHPRTLKEAHYIFGCGCLHEVNFFVPHRGCWFVDETIRSDGSLSVVTPVDPLFLVLHYLNANLKTASGKNFMLLDQTLVDSDFPSVQTELLLLFQEEGTRKQLGHVADMKTIPDSEHPAVRFNETKSLSWLEKKVRSLAEELKRRDVDIHGTRSASLVVAAKKEEDKSDLSEELLRYASEVVSDYLSFDMKVKLTKHLGLKTTPTSSDTPVAKRAKIEGVEEPSEDYTKSATPFSPANNKKASKSSKDLAKAAKGSASLMSFFKATPKKA